MSRRLLLLLNGDWEAAERSWAAALDHDLSNGDLLNAALNAYWLGQVRCLLGRAAEAGTALRRALSISLDGLAIPAELMARAELARLLTVHGSVDEAGIHLERCDAILGAGEQWRGLLGIVELARAAVEAAQGEHDLADAAQGRAVEVFGTYRLPWWSAEALLAWARWLETANRPGDAKDKREAAGAIYDEFGATDRWRLRLGHPRWYRQQ